VWRYVIFTAAVLMTLGTLGAGRRRKVSPLASIGVVLALAWACFGEK